MKRNSLLMCRNQPSLRMLADMLDELQVDQEMCVSADDAMESLLQGHYCALVLDFDLPGASHVARLARMAPANRRPVVFAMVGARTHVVDAFQAGANFMLYKPLAAEQAMRALRAGRLFMQPDRRTNLRHRLEALIYLQFGIAALPGLILDLSQRGLSLQTAEPLPAANKVPLRFVLPGTSHMVEGTGEVIWADDEGRAGMLFSYLSAASRKYLKNWLNKRSAQKLARRGTASAEKSYPSSLTAH
jgi:DNA-binding NarL/FixJ family response regulator